MEVSPEVPSRPASCAGPGAPQAAPAGRALRLLRREDLVRCVAEALEGALRQHPGLGAPLRARLRAQVLGRFVLLANGRTRRVRGLTRAEFLAELRRSHAALLAGQQRARAELEQLEQRLEAARGDARPARVWCAESAAGDARALTGALSGDLEALLASDDPRAGVAALLEREAARRVQALEGALAAEREQGELLARRVAKLRRSLEEMEGSLLELTRRTAADLGLPSIYRQVQGLDPDSPEREAKLGCLRILLEQNLALQKRAA